ncbi:hypothetical protein [Catellatospora vulcania]|uniref:hypothetical protein n=1 Tax=Catellatospora vulcania TaxID=1460450 RepID=UPI0012D387F9|nr:hypothetical protein [Catellatospora vulcania]
MTYDTRAQFNQGLVDSDEDRDRYDGVPRQDRSDDVVDGELVDPATEAEHRHDQDGVVHADARDGEPVEPVDLDGFDGTTEGSHNVATPRDDDDETPALEDVADPEPDATDDPVHPEAAIGEDPDERADEIAHGDDVQDETVAQAVADDEPVDSETRTLDDLADVDVPADDAIADPLDDEVVARDDTPADEPTRADQAVDDLTTPGATVDEAAAAELTGDDEVDEPVATDAADLATDDEVQVVGGPDAVDPPVTEPTDVGAIVGAASLWPAAAAEDLRTRWQAAQLRFVDDPPAVAAELRDLVGEAVRTLQESLADRQRELDAAFGDAGTDTEQLRLAVQQYRDFNEQLLER